MTYIFLESVIIKIIMESLEEKVTVKQCCKYSLIGFFFYCISPAGSAEQPAQLYAMHRDGISASKSVLALTIITITFKLSIILFGLGIYVFQPKLIMRLIAGINPLCVLGLILNGAMVALLVCMLSIPKTVKKGADCAVTLLIRLKIVKDIEKWNGRINTFFLKYYDAVRLCKSHARVFGVVLLITIVQRVCYLSITAVSCYAVGLAEPGGIEITALQGMIQLATEMLPLPGGMGASEIIYMKVFNPIFGSGTLITLIISRGISYYCQLVICGLTTAAITLYSKIKERKGEQKA